MFDDSAEGILGMHALAHLDPWRWSGSQSIEKTIEDLELVLKHVKSFAEKVMEDLDLVSEKKSKTRPIRLWFASSDEMSFKTIEEAIAYLQEISSEEIPSVTLREAKIPSTYYVSAPTVYVEPTCYASRSYVPAPTTYVAPTSYVRDVAIPSTSYVPAPTTYVEPASYARDIAIPSTSYVSAPTTYVEPMSYARDITWGQQRYVW